MIIQSERKLIIFEEFLDLKKHLSWISKISESVSFENIYCYLSSKSLNHDKKIMERLIDFGIKISMDFHYRSDSNNYFIVDNSKLNNNFLKLLKDESVVLFWDSLSADCAIFADRKNIILCQCTWQIDNFLKKNKIPLSQCRKSSPYNYQSLKLFDQIEFVITGNSFSYFGGDQIDSGNILNLDKFNNDFSTLLFYSSPSLREKQVRIGLEKLATYYNILVLSDNFINFKMQNISIVSSQNMAWAVKHSDFHLIPVDSDYVAFAMMHGLLAVPVFTRYFDSLKQGGRYLPAVPPESKIQRFISFTDVLAKDFLLNKLYEYIVPVDIESTVLLTSYLKKKSYWEKYKKNIRQIMHNELGVFYAEQADEIIQTVMLNLVRYGVPVLGRKVF